jgi:hypothetical protein
MAGDQGIVSLPRISVHTEETVRSYPHGRGIAPGEDLPFPKYEKIGIELRKRLVRTFQGFVGLVVTPRSDEE